MVPGAEKRPNPVQRMHARGRIAASLRGDASFNQAARLLGAAFQRM